MIESESACADAEMRSARRVIRVCGDLGSVI
jgi:hypothetical protein